MTTTSEVLEGRPVEAAIPEQKSFEGRAFPWVLEPPPAWRGAPIADSAAWFRANRPALEERLTLHGAVLFRGFPVPTPADFDTFVRGLDWPEFPYVGGAAPRTSVVGRVFTTNESPPDSLIPFHHEMAQVPKFPAKLYFYCEVAPEVGGETAICHSAEVYDRMVRAAPELVAALEALGVRYTRVLPEHDDPSSPIGRGWRSTYQTGERTSAEARALVEERARALQETLRWRANGDLEVTSRVLSAIREERRTRRKTWFNSIIAAYEGWKDARNDPEKAVCFGDGTPMDRGAMAVLRGVLADLAVAFPWKPGDILLVDNHLVLHSRRVFRGTRRVYASLVADGDAPSA